MEAQDVLGQFSATAPKSAAQKGDQLGQDDFMRLLVTQLKNQDPTKPMDNADFLTQIAQFDMVEGIQSSQKSLDAMIDAMFANRTLQATGLVGKNVVANSNVADLSDGGEIRGVVDLPATASGLAVQITNAVGQVVNTLQLGPSSPGRLPFAWDGLDTDGNLAPEGQYQVTSTAIINGAAEAVPAYAASLVRSVSVADGGAAVHLNLDNGSAISPDDVREFM